MKSKKSQPFPKKSKIKENSDVNDEGDVVPLPISTVLLSY